MDKHIIQGQLDFCQDHNWQVRIGEYGTIFVKQPISCFWHSFMHDNILQWIWYCDKCGAIKGGITKQEVFDNYWDAEDFVGRKLYIGEFGGGNIYDADEWWNLYIKEEK
jgi:hypothetical protein